MLRPLGLLLFLVNLFTMMHGGGFWFQWPTLGIALLAALRWTRAR